MFDLKYANKKKSIDHRIDVVRDATRKCIAWIESVNEKLQRGVYDGCIAMHSVLVTYLRVILDVYESIRVECERKILFSRPYAEYDQVHEYYRALYSEVCVEYKILLNIYAEYQKDPSVYVYKTPPRSSWSSESDYLSSEDDERKNKTTETPCKVQPTVVPGKGIGHRHSQSPRQVCPYSRGGA